MLQRAMQIILCICNEERGEMPNRRENILGRDPNARGWEEPTRAKHGLRLVTNGCRDSTTRCSGYSALRCNQCKVRYDNNMSAQCHCFVLSSFWHCLEQCHVSIRDARKSETSVFLPGSSNGRWARAKRMSIFQVKSASNVPTLGRKNLQLLMAAVFAVADALCCLLPRSTALCFG